MSDNIREARDHLDEFFDELTEAIRTNSSINHGKVREAKDLLDEEVNGDGE